MSVSTEGGTHVLIGGQISEDACRAVLERSCFGHLSLAQKEHVDVVPIRFVFVERSLYFRAEAATRSDIARNRWAVISVVDRLDSTHYASVVARGGCYAIEETGSPGEDVASLRGISRLRERSTGRRRRAAARTSVMYRLHVDALRGSTTVVPSAVGGTDPLPAVHMHAGNPGESFGDDARADDDGMREPRADR